MIAVGTSVLAALAVSGHACPIDVELQVEDQSLTWSSLLHRGPLQPYVHVPAVHVPPPRSKVTLHDGTPGARAIVRAIANSELACGKGRGMATVRVARGQVTVQISDFPAATANCLARAIERVRFARIDDEIARISIEL